MAIESSRMSEWGETAVKTYVDDVEHLYHV